jgi:O-antigen/teichoic acid export membrane protein
MGPSSTAGDKRLGARVQTVRQLVPRAAALATGRLAAAAFSAVWLLLAARLLSLSDFGDLSIILATTTVIISVSELGFQTALGIHTAQHGHLERRSFVGSLRRRMPAAAVGAVVNGVLYAVATHDTRWQIPALAAVSILCTPVYATLLTAYRSLGRVRADALNEVLSRVLVLTLGTVLLVRGFGIIAAVGAYAAGDAASAIVVAVSVGRKYVVRDAGIPQVDLRLRATLPLALVVIVLTVYNRLDTYMVALFKGNEAAGLYSAAYRFLDALTIPAIAAGALVLSLTMTQGGRERLVTLRKLAALAGGLGMITAVAGLFLAPRLLVFLYGKPFAPAGTCAILLLLSAPPSFVAATVLPIVVPFNRVGTFATTAFVLALNLICNLFLIPLVGLDGAAVANLIAQVVLCGGVYRLAIAQSKPAATSAPPYSGGHRGSPPPWSHGEVDEENLIPSGTPT